MVKRKHKKEKEKHRPLDPIRDMVGLAPLFIAVGVASQLAKILDEAERQTEIERYAKIYVDLQVAIQREWKKRETFRDRIRRLFTPQ